MQRVLCMVPDIHVTYFVAILILLFFISAPAGLKAITDFIKTLTEINISPDSPFLNLIGKK